jgi:putative flavoprotein involved in K+ transport
MTTVDTVVIGAGHAGLAVSKLLTEAGRDHVVLDRGRVGERWRTERWDSLHLLTPSWMTRLPGWEYAGPDPDGYLAAGELVELLEGYADSFGAPVVGGTTVESVRVAGRGSHRYSVSTDSGGWSARNVVVATGPNGTPVVPTDLAGPAELAGTEVLTARDYRNPAQLADGGVLVVGASASGVQIADELGRAGRAVTLAAGRHTRMPRRYRGLDIYWWMDVTGRLSRTIDQVSDPVAARRETSMQLVGRNDAGCSAPDLDLASLQTRGVRVVGRLTGISGRTARFADDLRENTGAADRVMHRFLDAVDDYVARAGLTDEVWPGARPRPVATTSSPHELDLRTERISTVVLATGYRSHHPWLHVGVTGSRGTIVQRRGVTPAPGLYTVGQRFQHRRDSGLIDGARHDARAVVGHLLGRRATVGSLGSPTHGGAVG